MATVELKKVTHISQDPGLCGAATAQMILHSQGLAGATKAVQHQIYEAIQLNTTAKRPTTKKIKTQDCPEWDTQKCAKCAGDGTYTCWCTYPPALESTLNQRGLIVTLTTHADDLDAAARILDCIDLNLAPAVLVEFGNHWVTVTGYETGTGPNDAVLIGGRWVSDIYFRDPNLTDSSGVTIEEWLKDYLSPVVLCGEFVGLHVVIGPAQMAVVPTPTASPTGAAPPATAAPPAPAAPTASRTVQQRAKQPRPARQRRPQTHRRSRGKR